MSIFAERADTALSPAGMPSELPLDVPDPLWDLLPTAIYVCDRGGLIVRYNRRAAELWGRMPKLGDPAERFCGSLRMYRLDGGPLPPAECPMAEVLRTGLPVRDHEVVIERPNGARAVVLVNIDVFKDSAGRIAGAVNCFLDITERKRIDGELRKSREGLEDFFENAAVAMHWVGPDGIILRANQAELNLLGYAREEYVGRHIGQFHSEPASIDDILARLSRGETLDKYPAKLRGKDGTIKHVQISSNVQFRDGEFVHTRCATVDVTAQKNLEAALHEGERRFHDLLGALPAAVYTTDADGRITYYNQAAVELAGREPTLGSDEWCVTWKLYHPDGSPMPHSSCPMAVAVKERRPIKGAEAVAERPDGTRVTFLAYPTPLYNAKGALVGAVNMLVDVTARKRAEALESAQGRALQMLAEGAPLKEILESLIDAIEQRSANGMLGSIVLLNESGTHFQRGMGLSLPEAFNAAVEGIAVSSFNGICCHAVASRDSVVVSDFNADPRWARFAEFVAPYGLRAGWSTPIFDSDGKVLGTFANYYRQPCNPTPQDLEWVNVIKCTAAIAIERKLAEQSGQRLISIVESSEDAIISKNIDGVITTWNPAAERLFGYKAQEIIGKPVTVLMPADRIDEEPAILERIRRGERIEHYETVRRRKDGTLVEIALSVSPLRNTEGVIVGASKIARDITERERAQEQQNLLLREMGHRVKNLFAVAGGLVTLSARSARTPTEMAGALRERLGALALAHGLTRSGLIAEGKDGHGATLHSLVQTIFSPYVDGRECVEVSCPDVSVGPNAVTGVAMVLHEFATNAVKYGALSRQEGFVSIDGAVENDVLLLIWEERDGPRLKGPPDHEGFGGTLADRIIKGQFGGELAYAWNPEGLIIRLSIPMAGLTK